MRIRLVGLLRIALLGGLLGAAAAPAEPYVPDALKAWAPWVLEGEEFHRCPLLTGHDPKSRDSWVCAWPGTLELAAGADRARFSQGWDVRAESWIELPGDKLYWPMAVTVDGRAAAVADRHGTPALRLGTGRYRVSGTIGWTRRPAQLAIPDATGLVALVVDGHAVTRPGRDGDSLWLGERPGAAPAQDKLELRVHRLLADGIPMMLETRLRIFVAGQGREELLPHAVEPGFVAVALESDLPARVEANGSVRVQVRPGTWELTLRARATGMATEIRPELAAAEEIWSYQSDDRVRVSVLEGVDAVDPGQAGVPDDWASLPAFRVVEGKTLQVAVRGESGGREANQLHLQRELWRDFDGAGYTAVDQVEGEMRTDWRLDMRPPFTMESARSGEQNLLVTKAAGGLTGVEVRDAQPNLQVVSRLPAGGAGGAATGYAQRFERIGALLHLPPAHLLLWARGADSAPDAWVNLWTLLDLFLLLLIAVGTGRLLGPAPGAIAFVALLVTYHESSAPVWAWVSLLAALALARFAPEGRLRRVALWYQHLSALALLVLLVPFVTDQARLLLHPQLEAQALSLYELRQTMGGAPFAPPPPADLAIELPKEESSRALENIVVTARRVERELPRYAPDTLVQTGPGIPAWRWHTYRLGWSGPVGPDDGLSLWILGRAGTAFLRLIGILASVALAALLLRAGYGGRWRWPAGAGQAAALLVGLSLWLPAPPASAADTPDAALLEELKNRLTRPPECAPDCALVESAAVSVENERLTARLRVHGLAATAVPLPRSANDWEPDAVTGAEVYRDRQGALWAVVGTGVTELVVTGSLAGLESVSIAFPAAPRSVSATARGWAVGGIREGRLASGALELSRLRQAPGAAGPLQSGGTFPPFVTVERHLEFLLDWSVATTVRRIAPAHDAINLEVDLLPGESVTSAEIDVRDGRAHVALPAGEDEVVWNSTLPLAGAMTLSAPKDKPWTEVWSVSAGPSWHVDYTGLVAVVPEEPQAASVPEFRPRPGDTLSLKITRPEAVPGTTLAIDSASLETTAGERSADTTLSFSYRSTRGARQTLTLPTDAFVQSLSVDGQELPARPREGKLELTTLPGAHEVKLRWREDRSVGLAYATPHVDLGASVANLNIRLTLPENRWLLLAFGPGTGPAFLYWSELVVFLAVAILLGRTSVSPLKTREWLLLGLGFSTFSWALLLTVAVWFFAMRWRGTMTIPEHERWRFNAWQIALGTLTVVAIGALVSGIPQALLGNPDMHVVGEGSGGNQLAWFTDRSAAALPGARVLSVHIWWYKAVMLAWALWIVFAFLRWLPWAWSNYSRGGIWRGKRPLLHSG